MRAVQVTALFSYNKAVMFTGNYKFADKTVGIISLYEDVHEYCKDYLTGDAADFTVTTAAQDIDFEKSRSDLKTFKDGYYEELAVYRKICEKMPIYDTFLFHGSVVAVDGVAYAFAAPSGTGKSTHAALWRELFGDRAVMVNDDKPLLRVGECVTAYGTPYDGKHRLSNKIAVPLKAVCLIERGAENRIERITASEAYPVLVQQTYRPLDVEALGKTMVLLDKLTQKVELYRLSCNMDIEAAKVAYEGMNGVC